MSDSTEKPSGQFPGYSLPKPFRPGTAIMVTHLPTTRHLGPEYGNRQVDEPEPAPLLEATIRVRYGFRDVHYTLSEPTAVLASDHTDRLLNAQRAIEQAVYDAFKVLAGQGPQPPEGESYLLTGKVKPTPDAKTALIERAAQILSYVTSPFRGGAYDKSPPDRLKTESEAWLNDAAALLTSQPKQTVSYMDGWPGFMHPKPTE